MQKYKVSLPKYWDNIREYYLREYPHGEVVLWDWLNQEYGAKRWWRDNFLGESQGVSSDDYLVFPSEEDMLMFVVRWS